MSLPVRKPAALLIVLIVILLVAIPLLWYRFLILGPPLPRLSDGTVDRVKLVAKYDHLLDPTRRSVVHFTLHPPDPEDSPIRSKVLGSYYLPMGQEPALDANDRPMLLLAQINLSDMTPPEGFPQDGMLQFFVSAYDDMLSCDWTGFRDGEVANYKNYEVRYHPVVDSDPAQRVSDFSFLPDLTEADIITALHAPASIRFSEAKTERMSYDDFRFRDVVGPGFFEGFRRGEDDALNAFWEELYGHEHKLGGYPGFTQEDPRWRKIPDPEPLELLFQIDTDNNYLMWGDAGIGNFFIRPSNLAKRDFSNVVFCWDN